MVFCHKVIQRNLLYLHPFATAFIYIINILLLTLGYEVLVVQMQTFLGIHDSRYYNVSVVHVSPQRVFLFQLAIFSDPSSLPPP